MTEHPIPAVRHDLECEHFPFTIVALSLHNGEVVWQHEVTGPGSVYVPALARQIGGPVKIRIEWPDGTVHEREP